MPITIDFPHIFGRQLPLFHWVLASMHMLFERLGRRLLERQVSTGKLVSATALLPVLRFYNGAITATVDRSQRGALTGYVPAGLTVEIGNGRRQDAFGFGRIPAGFDAALAISALLRAAAELLERFRSFRATPQGAGLEATYARFTGQPSSPMTPALMAAAPRLTRAAATILDTLTDFLNAIGGDEGEKRLYMFAAGVQAFKEAFPKHESGAEATDLATLARDAYRYLALALLFVPWLGLYLPALFRTALIGVRLFALAALEKIEGYAWDFRKSLLKLFYVDLEVYRRMAMSQLKTVGQVLLSQFAYYTSFAERYLFEVIASVSASTSKLGKLLATIVAYIQYIAIILSAIGESRGSGQKFPTTNAPAAPPPRPADSFAPFPNLSETLFGAGSGNALLQAVHRVRAMTETVSKNILDAGSEVLTNAANAFAALRDVESRVSAAQRFADVLADGERRVQHLMAPEQEWLREQAGHSKRLAALAMPLEESLATAGFDVIGAVIPQYVEGLREFWQHEKSAPQRPTSPHILAKQARRLHVRVPDVTVKASGRTVDDKLAETIAVRFRAAVDDAYRGGREKFLVAPAG